MRSTKFYKPSNNILPRIFLTFLMLFTVAYGYSQFQIVGMQSQNGSAWVTAQQAHLTIAEPGKAPYTANVPFDAYKQYASGTSFTTHAGTSISIMYKGQMQVLHPNSTLKVVIEKSGIKAQTLKGTVQHVLKDVKQKVGFYKAGNGYTWAHAEGTQFTVQSSHKSKAVNIATSEGKVVVTDEVPVLINQQASTKGGGRDGRELKTTVRTTNTAGQQYTTNQNNQTVQFTTYQDAIAAFERELRIKEQNGTAYLDELADNYTLIGELYLEIGEYDRAIDPLGKAVQYIEMLDPEDITIIDTSLYFVEAMMNSVEPENRTIGYNVAVEIINILIEELNAYIAEYNYANQIQDEEWAWDLCYDLVDINEYLGWSYELLNDMAKANEFYNWADTYDSRL